MTTSALITPYNFGYDQSGSALKVACDDVEMGCHFGGLWEIRGIHSIFKDWKHSFQAKWDNVSFTQITPDCLSVGEEGTHYPALIQCLTCMKAAGGENVNRTTFSAIAHTIWHVALAHPYC